MPCRSCAERRRMLAEARKKEGAKGVVKALPKVAGHLVKNPPKVK